MNKEELIFCPLGGSGEIGGNMNLYAYGKQDNQKWIIVDMGVSFADDSIPGVDLIMPDAGFIIDKGRFTWDCFNSCSRRSHWSCCSYLAKFEMQNVCNPFYCRAYFRKI